MQGTVSNPADNLTPAEPKERIPSLVDMVLAAPDWVSPSHWLLQAAALVCDGKNPAEEIAKGISGDWEGLAKVADGLRKMADFYEDLSRQNATSRGHVMSDWNGNAADAANRYFGSIEKAIAAEVQPIRDFAHKCDDTATGVWELAKGLTSAVEMLLDLLIDMALELAASAATAETVVGPIIGGAALIYTTWRASQEWIRILDILGKVEAIAMGVSGVAFKAVSNLSETAQVPLPKGAYDDPQA